MDLTKIFRLVVGIAFGAVAAEASAISYICDPNVPAATCNALNTTIAGIYNSTFTNASPSIYIQFGTTNLAASESFTNQVSYSTYVSALTNAGGSGIVRSDAIASLPGSEPALYGGADIDISSALGTALGFTGLSGITATGGECSLPNTGCYDGVITVTNDPSTQLYFRNGTIDPSAFDYFTVVEHETDEVLGTSSCIVTVFPALTNGCPKNGAAAVDLFRYSGVGSRVFIDNTPGAYFSYNGGLTNGANGAVYNTISNGLDYGDFSENCTAVQDAQGCVGLAGLDITNDGGAEINILDAIGFNVKASASTPEPGTITLIALGLLGLFGAYRHRTQ